MIATGALTQPRIADDASCEICLERIAAYRCCRCSFVLCRRCQVEFHKNVTAYQLLDQCGQCKKKPPWMTDKLHLQSMVVDGDGEDGIDVDVDVENQQERIYEPFISYETAKNMRRITGDFLLCFGTFLVAELIGFLFLLLSGESDMMMASVSKGNEHFILLILMLCGIIGVLILIASLIVLIPCAACVGLVIIGMIDQHSPGT